MALGAVPAHGETLGEAIAMAYESNPGMLIARSQLRQADEAYYRAVRNNLGPALRADVTISSGTDNDFVNGSGDNSGNARLSLSATQPIYGGGRINSAIRQQEMSLLSQREQLRTAEQTLVRSVVIAYVNVRRAEQALVIAQENVKTLDASRNESQERFNVGSSTQTDLQLTRARLAQAVTGRITAETTLANARAAYATVVGQLPGTLVEEPNLDAALPKSAEEALQIAFQENPTLRQRYLAERGSAAGVTTARAANKPTVSVTANASAADSFVQDPFPSRLNSGALTTGITLGIPLFSGLTTTSTIRSAVEQNKSDSISIEQQRRQVQQDVVSALNTLNQQKASISSNQEAVNAQRIANEGVGLEYQVGLKVQLDVLNSEQDLRTVETNLVNARFSAYTAGVDVLNAMGRLDPRLFGANITLYDPIEHFEEVNSFGLPWEPLVQKIDMIGVRSDPVREPGPGENPPPIPPLDPR